MDNKLLVAILVLTVLQVLMWIGLIAAAIFILPDVIDDAKDDVNDNALP